MHVPALLVRPISVDDIATAVAHVAVGIPLLGVRETAGPEEFRLADLLSRLMTASGRPDRVVTDPLAPFFGAEPAEGALLPGPDAHLGHHTFAQWLETR